MDLRSIPEQNVPPAPVSTAQRISSLPSISSQASAIPTSMGRLRAFLASGRFMVTTAVAPCRSKVRFSVPGLALHGLSFTSSRLCPPPGLEGCLFVLAPPPPATGRLDIRTNSSSGPAGSPGSGPRRRAATPQRSRRSCPGLDRDAASVGRDSEEVGDGEDADHQAHHEPGRHHRHRHHAQVGGEGPPHLLSDRQPERHADDDPDEGERGRLPGNRGGHLTIHEPEYLEQPDLPSPACHAHHEQVQQRRGAEQRQHDAEDEREVDGFSEVDQRDRRRGEHREGGVGVQIVVDRGLSPGPSHEACQHPSVGVPDHRLSTRGLLGPGGTDRCFVPGDGEQCTVSEARDPGQDRERHLGDHAEGDGPLAPRGSRHRDGHHRSHLRPDLAHRRRAQCHLTGAPGQMARDRGEQRRSPQRRRRHGPHGHLADRDLTP